MANPSMIRARELSKTDGRGTMRVEAVRGIEVQGGQGEIYGLVGPDGAGKTTTIQMLCGILTPTAGSGAIAGVDVANEPELLDGATGYMPEGFTLYENLSAEENLDFFADLHKVAPELFAERKERLLRFAQMKHAPSQESGSILVHPGSEVRLLCDVDHAGDFDAGAGDTVAGRQHRAREGGWRP